MPDTPNPARLIMAGLPGATLNDSARRLLDRGVGGVVLFGRNVESPQQVAALTSSIRRHAGRPLLIAIDQEGGRVARLRDGFTPLPSMRALDGRGDAALARRIGTLLADELATVGINLNFAPVVDVDTNPANPVIGDRSLSRDPAAVAELAAALIGGMQSRGVAACAKHFPGHGDTLQDSHHGLPRLPHAMDRLQRIELPPFVAAIEAGVASIMTAHIVFEALDAQQPATMSPAVLTGLLRGTLGFNGLIVTDCLQMRAVAGRTPVPEAALRAIFAGADLALISHDHVLANAAIDRLGGALASGELDAEQAAASQARVEALAARFDLKPHATPDFAKLGGPDHRTIVAGLADAAPAGADPTTAVGS